MQPDSLISPGDLFELPSVNPLSWTANEESFEVAADMPRGQVAYSRFG
jgi:hypothetical protein